MPLVYNALSWLSLIIGIAALLLSLYTANLAVLALSVLTLIHAAAWERVDKLAETIENLKAQNEST